ncbi:MAG: excinuclease ABC subunit B, partial [Psychrilyobacter sp.]|nr:excinuclease ABC subunit B [Psychrilyobacter sp.]
YLDLGVKVKYMHSGIDTLERIEIIRELRKKEFNVLVGINLLREGLDIPEVSLVAILEADKEGFLRSRRSLIQTMGRAARNVEGEVILYADIMTKSMKSAISETDRRREKQVQYNIDNNIDPKSTINEISEDLLNLDYGLDIGELNEEVAIYSSRKDIIDDIGRLKLEIKELASDLNFEGAIEKRDEMLKLEKLLLEL